MAETKKTEIYPEILLWADQQHIREDMVCIIRLFCNFLVQLAPVNKTTLGPNKSDHIKGAILCSK